jgi:hypothetical protein
MTEHAAKVVADQQARQKLQALAAQASSPHSLGDESPHIRVGYGTKVSGSRFNL